jgi:glycosyltransferase involved in cell wall biosynthesis
MVSVVAPVYGNAATVAELCRRLAAVLPGEHEILLVDDGCPHGSWAAIEAVPRARGIRHEVNRGQNAAVLTGLRAARGEEIVVLDADLQDPPEAVPRLLEELRRGDAAAVFGGRRGRYESGARMLASRLFKRTLRLLSGRRLPVDAGLFLAMGPEMRDALTAGDPPYLLAAMARSGLPMRSVPVTRARGGASAYSGRARAALAARALAQAARR